MRKISVSLANDRVELQRLKNRKQDLTLMMDGGEKQLKFLKSSNEEKQVEENILRLKLSQAELATSNVGGEVYNLEKYRIHLEAAMQERRAEIKAQKESLNIRKRMSSNECSELRLVISERNARICQLQARYDLNIAAMGNTEDGTPLTVTYLKIQCAQERYLLQEQGDKLDETIRKTEREIQSMENTLRIVNACNENYKANMGAMDEVDPEQEERAKLDLKLLEAIERNANVEAQLIQAKADLKTMQENYLQSINDIASAKEEKDRKQRHLANIERQITEQMQKILRADKCLRKVFKEIQRMCACTEDKIVLLQEGDIAARELQEQNGLALQHITEFTVRHVEAEAYVKNLLATKNMVLPCTTHLMSLTSSMQSLHSSSSRSSSSVSVPPSRNDTITSSKTFTGKLSDTNLQCVAHVLRISPCFGDVNVSGSSRKSVTTVERSVKVSDKSQRDKRSSGKKQ
ncbi:coiled-coil domain-containing protein 39 [Orussus abietinus]|uniref:coiled-coil domain-containing protein 39 n=1 Tax=Orussus abietinus TaxID=222816 RepID=UPI0006259013|nr:coiled-coil domain-containing protein 39 [Orussus abietinus]